MEYNYGKFVMKNVKTLIGHFAAFAQRGYFFVYVACISGVYRHLTILQNNAMFTGQDVQLQRA